MDLYLLDRSAAGAKACSHMRTTRNRSGGRDSAERSPLTIAPVSPSSTAGIEPEFGRWQDVQRLYGIKRSVLYLLLKDGVVQSVLLRRPGQKHGCRLIYLPSVREFLHRLMAEQIDTGIGDQPSAPKE
jgi:hypothetical protein